MPAMVSMDDISFFAAGPCCTAVADFCNVQVPPLTLLAIPSLRVTDVPFVLTKLPLMPGSFTVPIVPDGVVTFKLLMEPSSDADTWEEKPPRLVENPESMFFNPPSEGEISHVLPPALSNLMPAK